NRRRSDPSRALPRRCTRQTSAPARCGHWPASAPGSPPTGARAGSPPSGVISLGRLQPGAAGRFRKIADASDIGLSLGDADHTARLQGVEDVAGLDRLLVGRDRQLRVEAALALV